MMESTRSSGAQNLAERRRPDKFDSQVLAVLSWIFLFLSLTISLREFPGLHYDEAWAALFAKRIATESGFFPFEAMSPYTAAWGHWVAAGFFKFIGVSLLSYRLSGVFLVTAGVLFICRGLTRLGYPNAAHTLPLLIGSSAALFSNHRFVIDLTSVHVLCGGALFWAMIHIRQHPERNSFWLTAALTIGVGVTSHILFVAPTLVAWIAWRLGARAFGFAEDPRAKPAPPIPLRVHRLWVAAIISCLAVHFSMVHDRIPETEKTTALLLACAILLWDCYRPATLDRALRWAGTPPGKRGTRGLLIFTAPLWIYCLGLLLIFLEGSWSQVFNIGYLSQPEYLGWGAIATFILLSSTRISRPPLIQAPLARIALLLTVLVTLVATKPTPRYYELPMILALAALAVQISQIGSRRWRILVVGLLVAGGSTQILLNSLIPGLQGMQREAEVRLAILHDSSADTLPKQTLAQWLGGHGFKRSDVQTADSRLAASLDFLSNSDRDWPITPTVETPQGVEVGRRSQLGNTQPDIRWVGEFWVKDSVRP